MGASASREPPKAVVSETTADVQDVQVPAWLSDLRRERRPRYRTDAYRFDELIRALVKQPAWPEGSPGDGPLEMIHDVGPTGALPATAPRFGKIMHAFRHAGWKMPPEWRLAMRPGEERRSFKAFQTTPEWIAFMETYARFVREEVAPLCGDPAGVVYQCPPTLRIAMPSVAPTIALHRDREYPRHQPAEINFWVPVTAVAGNSALWVESDPELGDFHPVDMEPGEFLMFDGHNCRHVTKPNDTGQTRVSFDFRVVPQSLYVEVLGQGGKRKMGDYFVDSTGPVELIGRGGGGEQTTPG